MIKLSASTLPAIDLSPHSSHNVLKFIPLILSICVELTGQSYHHIGPCSSGAIYNTLPWCSTVHNILRVLSVGGGL